MAISNSQRIGQALELVRDGLAPFVERELRAAYGDGWKEMAKGALKEKDWKETDGVVQWEVSSVLAVLWNNWNSVFSKTLGQAERSYVNELRIVRNRWAHQDPLTYDDTYRALDTMHRLLRAVSAPQAEEVHRVAQEVLRVQFDEQRRTQVRKKSAVALEGQPVQGLPPWRHVVAPHPDVASGRYQQAEFAADLALVHRGEASDEYGDPREFFRRTYLTLGLEDLLKDGLLRLTGRGGAPVVELQTNFGGGKTHSMLALYHLFSGVPAQELAGMEGLLNRLGIQSVPSASRAVLVGTALNPGQPQRKPDGTITHTLWGELAWQLGGPEGYRQVAENDANGVSPGSQTLSELFKRYAPCLILIDEWVAYARQTYGKTDLPGGSFDANMTFAQAVTEAARGTPRTMLVASIPASQIEIGGEGGREALVRIQNTFSRMESAWRPATAEESYEIVRRRLFEPIVDPKLFAARDAVIRAFINAYKQAAREFPNGVGEKSYERRMQQAYPIHPELFDRLYEDWSSLERFQRTRGVLRLMATVIFELWERQDSGLLILPASIPLDAPSVQTEMTRYLEDNWRPIMERDVDGPEALPLKLDRENASTLGRFSAARRVARTIFMGSAPLAKTSNPGIDDRRVKLGCFQPGETAATFGDALRRLRDQATHLYSDGTRYWFSTQPSVVRLARDRAAQVPLEDAWQEVVRRMRSDKKRGEFAAVHVAPESSADVPDEMEARLVILGPQYAHVGRAEESQAKTAAWNILQNRGNNPRYFKNSLAFLAADKARLEDLSEAARLYLAWDSIWREKEALNLDPFQSNQTESQRKQADAAVDARIREAFIWLLTPYQRDPMSAMELLETRLQGQDAPAERACRRMVNDGNLMVQFSATNLKLQLDKHLWKDVKHLSVKKLWEYFASYLYLPRLRDSSVLIKAIQEGVGHTGWERIFAYAEGYDEAKDDYLGLKAGQNTSVILDGQSVLVKPEAALEQLRREREKPGGDGPTLIERPASPHAVPDVPPGDSPGSPSPQPTKTTPRRFHGTVSLDPIKLTSSAGKVAEEVLQHLSALMGADVEITLEIQVRVPSGFPDDVVRTVSENCATLKFHHFEFEEN
uniref:ATP-binding protein n=1 Tax=Desulfacinum infernum TaxID=35837 RepID=A0A832A0Q1_9BACT